MGCIRLTLLDIKYMYASDMNLGHMINIFACMPGAPIGEAALANLCTNFPSRLIGAIF